MRAPAPTPRKRRPSYSLSERAITSLDALATDTAARRGTTPNRTAMLEELIEAEVRRRHLDGAGAAAGSVKGRAR